MAFAPDTVSFDRGDASILGGFYEKECGNWFEFSRNDDDFDFARAYPHKVWVTTPRQGIDSGYRYATVKNTVAYVVVDEDANGAVIEKWELKQNSKRDYIRG
jgi:hypothetical protein